MKILKKYKLAVIFYLIMLGLTLLTSARMEKLESREDYHKYSENVAINYEK